MSEIQRVLVKHRKAVLVPDSGTEDVVAPAVLLTALMEIKNLGYLLDAEVVEGLADVSNGCFVDWTKELIYALKELKGANYQYVPFYPNFPEQVATASELELYTNAVVHYLGDAFGYRYVPSYTAEPRAALKVEDENLIVLSKGTSKSAVVIFNNLIGGKISLNDALTKDVKVIINHLGHPPVVPDISNKENLATYLSFFDYKNEKKQLSELISYINNPVDILRIVATKGGSDPSLTGKVTFSRIPRWMRRSILMALNKFSPEQLSESFRARAKLWKAFFAYIHAAEYCEFEVVQEVIKDLRNSTLTNDFNSSLEKAIAEKDMTTAMRLLKSRPTIFVRRLREIACVFPDEWEAEFLSCGQDASLTSLLQALSRFRSKRDNYLVTSAGRNGRTGVYPAKVSLKENDKQEIARMIESLIQSKLQKMDALGKVYYAPPEAEITVPFGLRTGADSSRLLGRGSRLEFDTDATLRFFVHWKDLPNAHVDVDLSATLLDEDCVTVSILAFWKLRDVEGQHSGDITSAPDGAAEFVDVNIPSLRRSKPSVRYIAMSCISFSGEPFAQIPEILAGFMIRTGDAQVGEIFDARTVDTAFTISSPSRSVIPFLFDVQEGKAIWLDLNTMIKRSSHTADRIGGVASVLAHAATKHYISLNELLLFHLNARSTEQVENPDDADQVIIGNDITFDEILANWL